MLLVDDVKKYFAGTRILLIDDSEPFQKLTTLMLEKLGVETVIIASTLAEGMTHLQLTNPDETPEIDLILMDLNLPDGNGMLGCEFVSKHALTHQIPVVVISGNHELSTIRLVLNNGASDYLQKPLVTELLGLRLGLLLKLKHMDEFYMETEQAESSSKT